ncbi:MAG: DUF5009 domain-containing protein [Bacteroidales bacterium]|nr:DUF5009 domain-containing protein [Bacteroidales bacterium]MCF8391059.1 DUF5009 domain-containing protein [Bacteroidales bacterium]
MTKQSNERLYSLDALRGFDMFWIAGGAAIFNALAKTTDSSFIDWISLQTEHAVWNGFQMFDLIFPLFLFIAGVSFPFSLAGRRKKGHTEKRIYRHIIQRGVVLVLLGIVYNGFFTKDFSDLRFASVLGRIGLAWMFAAIIVMNAKILWQGIWFIGLLIVYWGLMMLVPVPGFGAGVLTVDGSLAAYIDQILVPGRLYLGTHDPEGLFSTIPAVSTALMGMLTGHFLKSKEKHLSQYKKFYYMLGAGVAFIGLAYLWNLNFPINKNLWTSSFVFLTGGISLVFLSFFYLILDIWRIRWWAYPFMVIGLNPITIYLAQAGMIDFNSTSHYFFSHFFQSIANVNYGFWMATMYLTVSWLFLYFLHKKNIYLKV